MADADSEMEAGPSLTVPSDSDCPVKEADVVMTEKGADASNGESKPETVGATERSFVNVIFTDWVPEDDVQGGNPSSSFTPSFTPTVGGSRPRYYQQIHTALGKVRPGLGSDLEALAAKAKSKPKRKKRKSTGESNFQDSISKKPRIMDLLNQKPPCQVLHEHAPDLKYTYEEFKVENNPSFTCSVQYPPSGDTIYTGEGRSKKLAKNDVAEKVLSSIGIAYTSFLTEPNNEFQPEPNADADMLPDVPTEQDQCPTYGYPSRDDSSDIDFTTDDLVVNPIFSPYVTSPALLSQPMVDSTILKRLKNIPNFEENICLVLNTIVSPTSIEYKNLHEEGPPHDRQFTIELNLNLSLNEHHSYIGIGGSKKRAKADAAKKAVKALLGNEYELALAKSPSAEHQMPLSIVPQNEGQRKKSRSKRKRSANLEDLSPSIVKDEQDEDEDDDDSKGEYDSNFSDFISNCVREKFDELFDSTSNFATFKVLAGVVMTTGSPMMYNSKVITVTTGTKCIEGDSMSEVGGCVNDCHAEILATRCVRDYLYSQIELFENSQSEEDKNQCILDATEDQASPYKYRLKNDTKFHLYISTSPCGDARIFSPNGIEIEEEQLTPPDNLEDAHPNKLNRGVLRSKVEAGEGTIPSTNLYSGPQTWDSIIAGTALYTMSCSDKVCRWNVLGLQGALLYNFLGPIYYSSITLGSLHHPVHFKRAVYGRVELLNSRLEFPFHVNKPELMMVSHEGKRKVKKSPNHAICWALNWSTPEVLSANKGRCEGAVISRITKRILFSRFLKLYKNVNGRRENYVDLSYHEAKQEARNYQETKLEFVKYFKESNLGPWIGKPIEQDSFRIR